MTKLNTASVLAFERNLDVSDAFFWQSNSQDEMQAVTPVSIVEKSVRGTISNRLSKKDASDANKDHAKLDAKVESANLQKVDSAALDAERDTLIARWSCKVLPFNGKPNVCNDQEYQQALESVVQGYIEEHGVAELAKRYALNIVNGRWLWRNRVGAEGISITIECGDATYSFDDAKQYALNSFDSNDDKLQKLSNLIEQGLLGKAFVILYVEAKAVVGFGQEVFPSQELILDTGKTKSKVLYQVNGKAGMHSQKVANAIRTIDTWYKDAEFPIAIEPYGAVTTMGKAFRQPKQKQDFYTLFDNWVLKGEKPDVEQQHYVMAVLIRGGVFGASGKE